MNTQTFAMESAKDNQLNQGDLIIQKIYHINLVKTIFKLVP